MTSNKLPRQDSDPIWTKPCVPQAASCLPTPIPPRNEPSISIYITPIGDDIDSLTGTPGSTSRSLPQTLQLAEVDVPTSVTPESGLQVGICCIFDLHIPTYVLRSWLDCLVRIPSLLAILFGRNHL